MVAEIHNKKINTEWGILSNGKKRQLEKMSNVINAEWEIMSNGKKCWPEKMSNVEDALLLIVLILFNITKEICGSQSVQDVTPIL